MENIRNRKFLTVLIFFAIVLFTVAGLDFSGLNAFAATNTDGNWTTGQTIDLIPDLTGDTLLNQGWGIWDGNQVNANGWWSDDYGYVIRAQDPEDDLGTRSYTGGVYYTIELSEADRVKADLGQLTLGASSVNWFQASAHHYISIRVYFYDSNGAAIGSGEENTYHKNYAAQKDVPLTLSGAAVPAGTCSIQVWFSNWGTLSGRPFIANPACYLYDSTAPSFSGATLEKTSVADSANNRVVTGDTFKYCIGFNEKVSISSSGTATVALNGSAYLTSSSSEIVTENGKSRACYTFILPEGSQSGTLALSSVSGLTVADEAGNSYTYSGRPSAETLKYYKTMSVSSSLSHVGFSGESYATYNTDYTASLVAVTGYSLPSAIKVTVGGATLTQGSGYSYNSSTGAITINGGFITGDIVVTASGVAKSYTVSLDMQGGSMGSASVTATYDSAMPAITLPVRTGYMFGGYFTQTGGNGTQYYGADGSSLRNFDQASGITLYALWTANTYTVVYNANKPSGASGTVTGSTVSSSHTYDTQKELSANGFTLVGWTFQGWATSASGGVVYENGAQVKNLTAENGGTVNLYAVWKANTYTVVYNANKPSGASGTVTGSTVSSSHTYDTQKVLSVDGYSLTGYTFQGWATSASGGVEYENGAQVKNLVAEEGGTFNLYAVWKANTYSVIYNVNQPAQASSAVGGSMQNSSHTYDISSGLSANGYSLTGWTFQGWATSTSGGVVYENGAQVKNLVVENGGTFNLYAVWKANTYSVIYNVNQPAQASSAVGGSMQNSSHTYDISSGLSANGYSLTGWTFQGWATSASGNVVYENAAQVKNLTAENGGTFNLYAVWEQTLHQITFNACGGSGSGTVNVLYDGELPALVTEPSRKGYNFKGYYTQENGNGVMYYGDDFKAVVGLTYTAESNLVLYACWVPIRYDIELYSQGQYVGIIENVVYGELLLPSARTLGISRPNYDFVGWNLYDEQNWSMYNADASYNVGLADFEGEKVSVHAAWLEKNIYTINFDANGGFGAPAMAQAHETETVILSATVPSRADYTFVGWAETADAAEAQYLPDGEFTMGDSVVTLYAVWRLNPSLSYSANGGEFINNLSVVYPASGSSVTITAIKPVRTGYDFIGWATADNAETAQYVSGETFTMPSANTVLYAVWKRTEFTVSQNVASGYAISGLSESYFYGDELSFSVTGENPKVYINGTLAACDGEGRYSFTVTENISVVVADSSSLVLIYSANGGSGAPTDGSIYSIGSVATLSEVIPVRTGYTFCGWSISKDAQSADYEAGGSLTFSDTDVILHAVWCANSYTVIYNAAGGEGAMQDSAYSYGTIGYLSENVFVKEGFTFVGWAFSEGGECVFADGDEVLNLSDENGANIALYAVWEQIKTLITFDADGGTGGSANLSVGYGETLSASGLIAPVRNGYTFGGYFTEKEGNGEMLFDRDMLPVNYTVNSWDRTEQNLTLYAYWIPSPETIMNDVRAAIDEVQSNLESAVAELQATINANETDIEAKVSALNSAYQAADALLRSDMTAKDEELDAKITALETAMNQADLALQTAIETVQSNLDNAVAELQATINANETDIEAKVSALDSAYQAADALLRSDMTAKDEELEAKITALETAMNQADSALQTAINTVQSNLESAVAELQATITANETDIEAKVLALDSAYQAADALLRSDMTAKDEELEAKITALETAMNQADLALRAGIQELQQRLNEIKAELDMRDDGLESELNLIIAENEKMELTYRIIIIIIAAIEAILVVLFVINTIKKKKTK